MKWHWNRFFSQFFDFPLLAMLEMGILEVPVYSYFFKAK
jgi:hypothetical protein